jgi:hypothetical protein
MDLIKKINNEIAQRTSYGLREEIASGRGYVLSWSNASRKWNIGYYMIKTNEIINLDANQIFIRAKKQDIIAVLGKVNELPLYKNSTEYLYGKAN